MYLEPNRRSKLAAFEESSPGRRPTAVEKPALSASSFSDSRQIFTRFKGVVFAFLCGCAVILPQIRAQTSAPATSIYINPAFLPAPARGYLFAFGDRLQVRGKERTTLVGTFTGARGTGSAQLTWEAPGRVRLDGPAGPALIYDDVAGLQNPGGISDSDTNALESLFDDAPQSFLYGFRRRAAYRFLGSRFRTDNGRTPNYQGPWYDIYDVVGPALAKPGAPSREKFYYFDNVTGLLWKTVYVLAGAVTVSTEYNKWTNASGNAFPGQVVRKENGSPVFTLNVTGALVTPAVNDGLFPNH